MEEPSRPTVVLMGTCDTKWDEMCYTQQQILAQNTCTVLLMDIGRTPNTDSSIALPHPELRPAPPSPPINTDTNTNPNPSPSAPKLSSLSRPAYIQQMTNHAIPILTTLHRAHRIHAVLSLGGSCGTALATAIMQRALPLGFPKLMVSTMASGNVAPYVQESDMTIMHSVVDIAGSNELLHRILANAAAAAAGMAMSYHRSQRSTTEPGRRPQDRIETRCANATCSQRPTSADRDVGVKSAGGGSTDAPTTRIGITMFGVTTPAVERIRARLQHHLADKCSIYVFHATGAGGKALERLVHEHHLDAVIDLTTTEIADELMGGVLTAGAGRLRAAAAAGIPSVISVGACDMVNFGARGTLPAWVEGSSTSTSTGTGTGRVVVEHNPAVTLVRTTPDECRRIAQYMAETLRDYVTRPDRVRVVLPMGGLSLLDAPGQPFYDPEADEALFSTLEEELEGSGITVRRLAQEINDSDFADFVADCLVDLLKTTDSAHGC